MKFQKFRNLGKGALKVVCWHYKGGAVSQCSVLKMASGSKKLCFRRRLAKVKCRVAVPVAQSKWIKAGIKTIPL